MIIIILKKNEYEENFLYLFQKKEFESETRSAREVYSRSTIPFFRNKKKCIRKASYTTTKRMKKKIERKETI